MTVEPHADHSAMPIEQSAVPIALVALGDLTVRAVNPTALNRLGMTGAARRGTPVLDLVAASDRRAATAALTALRDGVVDFYLARRAFADASAVGHPTVLWVRAVDLDGERLALIEFGLASEPRSALAALAGREPPEIVIGCVDEQWTVTTMSRGARPLETTDLVGSSLLDFVSDQDGKRLVAARRQLHGMADTVALEIVMRPRDAPKGVPVCVVMTPLDGEQLLVIVMSAVETRTMTDRRVTLLESHLRTIAREVEASGVLRSTRVAMMPPHRAELASLTSRQWEVLTRLLQGDRVPKIATDLYLGQSTVRNHLSAIFKTVGVHSQAELLALLREPTDGVSI